MNLDKCVRNNHPPVTNDLPIRNRAIDHRVTDHQLVCAQVSARGNEHAAKNRQNQKLQPDFFHKSDAISRQPLLSRTNL